jgi:hypothetical protein
MSTLRSIVRTYVRSNARLHYLSDRVRTGVRLKYQVENYGNKIKTVPLWKLYLSTLKSSLDRRDEFRNVSAYVMFIGHERSGHSLVGAVLDAHPEMIISHEQNTLPLFAMGFTMGQLYSIILDSSKQQADVGRGESGYNYVVPGQWQGRYRTLRVIGDKDARRDTSALVGYPELLERLKASLAIPLRVIHVVRNPYDNLATLQARHRTPVPIETVMDRYFAECETIEKVSAKLEGALIVSRHEDFVQDPKPEITRLCNFVGLDTTDDYLADCASIVRASTNKSRKKVAWTAEQRARVDREIERYSFLRGYNFND